MGISSLGVGSGLDISSLVDQLVAVERQGTEQLLNRKQSSITTQLSALGKLKSAVTKFKDSLEPLTDPGKFRVRSGSSSNTGVATATVGADAASGSYSVVVSQLASAQKLKSTSNFADTNVTAVGTGNLTISNGNGGTFTLSFAGGGDNTLAAIRDAINDDADNFGVSASILGFDDGLGGTQYKLILSADDTGADFGLTITADPGLAALGGANYTELNPALDASLTIDGETVTRSTNTISGALTGVDINLVATGSTTISVQTSVSGVVDQVKAFVNAYNSLRTEINTQSSYNKGNPGPLYNDSLVRSLEQQMRSILGSDVASITGNIDSLARIGITSDDKTGLLKLKETDLNKVLDTDFDAVSDVFTATDGVATTLNTKLDFYTRFAGLFEDKTDSLQQRLKSIGSQRDRLDRRLIKLEERLKAQFIAMDALVAQLNSTSSYLSQNLASLNKSSK